MAVPLYPLKFTPYLRPMPWGGDRLKRWVPADWPAGERIGEAWLLSDHPVHSSVVINGPLAGSTLRQLMAERSEELLGFRATRFPLLIKLLDARENLSIQVHPNDDLARQFAPNDGGKTEAWWVLEADANASIYLGLKPGFDRAAMERELQTGNLPLCLNRYTPHRDEWYFVPAGTVHALGGGCVVLEVQQTSDATFRLFDWGRVGTDGKPRAVHLREGLACLKERPAGAGLVSGSKPAAEENSLREKVNCEFFSVTHLTGPGCWQFSPVAHVIFGLKTPQTIGGVELLPGEVLLVPAAMAKTELRLNQGGQVMQVLIPRPRTDSATSASTSS